MEKDNFSLSELADEKDLGNSEMNDNNHPLSVDEMTKSQQPSSSPVRIMFPQPKDTPSPKKRVVSTPLPSTRPPQLSSFVINTSNQEDSNKRSPEKPIEIEKKLEYSAILGQEHEIQTKNTASPENREILSKIDQILEQDSEKNEIFEEFESILDKNQENPENISRIDEKIEILEAPVQVQPEKHENIEKQDEIIEFLEAPVQAELENHEKQDEIITQQQNIPSSPPPKRQISENNAKNCFGKSLSHRHKQSIDPEIKKNNQKPKKNSLKQGIDKGKPKTKPKHKKKDEKSIFLYLLSKTRNTNLKFDDLESKESDIPLEEDETALLKAEILKCHLEKSKIEAETAEISHNFFNLSQKFQQNFLISEISEKEKLISQERSDLEQIRLNLASESSRITEEQAVIDEEKQILAEIQNQIEEESRALSQGKKDLEASKLKFEQDKQTYEESVEKLFMEHVEKSFAAKVSERDLMIESLKKKVRIAESKAKAVELEKSKLEEENSTLQGQLEHVLSIFRKTVDDNIEKGAKEEEEEDEEEEDKESISPAKEEIEIKKEENAFEIKMHQEVEKMVVVEEEKEQKIEEIQEKNEIIQENNQEIQENNEIIQENNQEIQENNEIIQEKNEIIQEKNEIIQEKIEIIQENKDLIEEKPKTIETTIQNEDFLAEVPFSPKEVHKFDEMIWKNLKDLLDHTEFGKITLQSAFFDPTLKDMGKILSHARIQLSPANSSSNLHENDANSGKPEENACSNLAFDIVLSLLPKFREISGILFNPSFLSFKGFIFGKHFMLKKKKTIENELLNQICKSEVGNDKEKRKPLKLEKDYENFKNFTFMDYVKVKVFVCLEESHRSGKNFIDFPLLELLNKSGRWQNPQKEKEEIGEALTNAIFADILTDFCEKLVLGNE